MKQEELKISLGKIQPREELIQSTLAKVRDQKMHREQRSSWRSIIFSISYNKGLRLAGAVCAFALVFFMGYTAAPPHKVDFALTLSTDPVSNYGVRMASHDTIPATEWLTIRGQVKALHFTELTEEEDRKVIASAQVQISVSNIEEKSDQLSRKDISTDLTATVLLYDTESLNLLVNPQASNLLFRLIPTENGGWNIYDFYPAL